MDPDLSDLINKDWYGCLEFTKGDIEIAQVICNGHHPQRRCKIPGDNSES